MIRKSIFRQPNYNTEFNLVKSFCGLISYQMCTDSSYSSDVYTHTYVYPLQYTYTHTHKCRLVSISQRISFHYCWSECSFKTVFYQPHHSHLRNLTHSALLERIFNSLGWKISAAFVRNICNYLQLASFCYAGSYYVNSSTSFASSIFFPFREFNRFAAFKGVRRSTAGNAPAFWVHWNIKKRMESSLSN